MNMLASALGFLPFKYHVVMPLLAKLPRQSAYRLVTLYGRLQLARHKDEIRSIALQLQTVFKEKDIAELEEWARYFFCMLEREILDIRYFQKLVTFDQVEQLVKLVDYDELVAARKQGRRVILTSGHFSRVWMVGLGLKAHGLTMGAIIRDRLDNNDQGLPEAEFQYRIKKLQWLQERFQGPFLTEDAIRPVFKALDEHVMAILIDVPVADEKKTGSIELPFFGRPAVFPMGTARIAKKAKAMIVPFYVNESRQGMEIQFQKGIEAESMSEADIMRHLVALLESQVRKHPEQWWLWQVLPLFWKS